MSAAPLSIADLFLASSLVLITGALSAWHGLGIEKRLAIAAGRMVAQLALVGMVLKFVFVENAPVWTALLALVMVAIAAYEAGRRQSNRITGHGALLLSGVTLLLTGVITTLYVTAVVVTTDHWFTPRVFLPILGMVLGNALTAVALVLESLTEAARNERAAIEARLALGATAQIAFQAIVRRTLTTALLPTINGMAVAGIVSLPGMMTGQILAGADPAEAAKYQIMIMFAIAGATALSAVAAAYGAVRLLTDDRARLRLDRIAANP